MIIFDLDGTLADCEHRRHLVEEPPIWEVNKGKFDPMSCNVNCENWRKWKPDYKTFNDLCHLDKPIYPVVNILQNINCYLNDIQIWSGRCESQREKTIAWITEYCFLGNFITTKKIELKMRPIGDFTPDEQLKERWLDERPIQHDIDFVFDDSETCCNMWRSRGIFVFNVNQSGKAF